MAVWLPVVQAQQPTSPSTSDMASVWTDPATGLMWTKQDNGSDVTWNQASAYCANLRLGGNSDWRLPTIDELQGIYDSSVNSPGVWNDSNSVNWVDYRVKGNLRLSGWHWSSSSGNASGEAWLFSFVNGMRYSYRPDVSNMKRALCMRGYVLQAKQPASPSTSDMASVWTDPGTGLTWTKNDNGSDVNWNQASAYCANLRLGGNSGWRLPTIDELQRIYDPSISITMPCGNGDSCIFHVKGYLKLSGWHWSSFGGRCFWGGVGLRLQWWGAELRPFRHQRQRSCALCAPFRRMIWSLW